MKYCLDVCYKFYRSIFVRKYYFFTIFWICRIFDLTRVILNSSCLFKIVSKDFHDPIHLKYPKSKNVLHISVICKLTSAISTLKTKTRARSTALKHKDRESMISFRNEYFGSGLWKLTRNNYATEAHTSKVKCDLLLVSSQFWKYVLRELCLL